MHWGRKFALLMLAAVVLWTAMPVSACVVTMQSNARAACCGDMAQGGPMQRMKIIPACCRIRATDPAVVPVSAFSPEHSLKPMLVAYPASVDTSANSRAGWRLDLKAPPPKSLAGAISILRI